VRHLQDKYRVLHLQDKYRVLHLQDKYRVRLNNTVGQKKYEDDEKKPNNARDDIFQRCRSWNGCGAVYYLFVDT